ncbi:MAG: hypothetical protein N2C14_09325, partial [Planctomycetales bacterium]
MRLLFAKAGRLVCLDCDREIRRDRPENAAADLERFPHGARLLLCFATLIPKAVAWKDWTAGLREDGFQRCVLGEKISRLDETSPDAFAGGKEVLIIVDRLTVNPERRGRLLDSLETAFVKGSGACVALVERPDSLDPTLETQPSFRGTVRVDDRDWLRLDWSRRLACAGCGRAYPSPDPRLFHADSSRGACPSCEGTGRGSEDSQEPCGACGGIRLRPESLAYRVAGRNLAELTSMPIHALSSFLREPLSPEERATGAALVEQAASRLECLESLGLGYLSLNRATDSLSRGESNRAALVKVLSASLVDALYVLDEPSAGLHPLDVER